ncbi:MAG: hypothetical protein NVSMB55_08320 [Mycobacteriales bacterium]
MAEEPIGLEDVDVDARFLLANERTLLAWVRTALTLLAAGAALAQLGHATPHRIGLATVVIALGIGAAVAGALRYLAADRALRRAVLPDRGWAPVVIAVCVAVLGVLVIVVVLDAR